MPKCHLFGGSLVNVVVPVEVISMEFQSEVWMVFYLLQCAPINVIVVNRDDVLSQSFESHDMAFFGIESY
jgi:hypothetical protein